MTTKVTGSVLANTAVTAGTYGGAGSTPAVNHLIPVVTVDAQGRLTSAANVTITNTAVYANSGQLTTNTATGVVAVGLATSGAIAGSYGSGTQTPVLTIDAYGRVTSVSATTITGGSAGIGATTYNRQSNTASASQTVFTVTGGYTVGYLQVYLNGVLLNSGDYTASNGTSFTLGVAAVLGDIVESLAYTVTNVLNVSPSPSGGSAGQVLYQSAANTTANTDVGTANYLLTSQGTGKPTWSAQSALVIANTQITGVMTASQLASTAVTPGTYGGTSNIPVITVDQQGRLTSSANVPVTITGSSGDFYSYYTGTLASTTGTYTASTSGLGPGSLVTVTGSGTTTSSGTTMTVSAQSTGAVFVGSTVTFPGFVGTATSSATTLTVATATAGAIDVGTVLNTNCSITASKATTVLTVSAVASGGIHVGMSISGVTGTITSFGTGTGGVGTYNMSTSQTVASGAKTGTGTLTITALGTGTGGVGTYTTDKTYTYTTASAITTSSGSPTRTVSALGSGVGGAGTYTLSSGITATTTSYTSTGSLSVATSTGPTTGTLSQAITIISISVVSGSGTYTIPTGVTKLKATVLGAGGAGGNKLNGSADGTTSGAMAIAFLTGLTPGATLNWTIGNGGIGNNTTGATGGSSSLSSGTQTISTITATGGPAGSGGASASGGHLNIPGFLPYVKSNPYWFGGGPCTSPSVTDAQKSASNTPYGNGGISALPSGQTAGTSGTGYGVGGGIGYDTTGGSGAPGFIMFEY